jgi:hypothetical protein
MITCLKKYLPPPVRNKSSGFTLIELLTASMMTLVVVGVAGYGAVVMVRENTSVSIASDTQYNLNRAVDFITDEIRSATSVSTGDALPSGCGTGTATLKLTIPYTVPTNTPAYSTAVGTPSPYNVYYHTKAPSATWLGNNAIFRCGPSLKADGSVGVDDSTGLPVDPSNEVLVDLIASGRDSNDGGTCGQGTAYPNNNQGFFVCVSGDRVELHAASSALNVQTSKDSLKWIDKTNTSTRFYDKATYGIINTAYARASTAIIIGTGLTFSSSAKATLTNISTTASACTTTAITIITGGSSATPTSTTESWSSPSTNLSFTTSGTLAPSINSPIALSPIPVSASIAINGNQATFDITGRTGCKVQLTLRR